MHGGNLSGADSGDSGRGRPIYAQFFSDILRDSIRSFRRCLRSRELDRRESAPSRPLSSRDQSNQRGFPSSSGLDSEEFRARATIKMHWFAEQPHGSENRNTKRDKVAIFLLESYSFVVCKQHSQII